MDNVRRISAKLQEAAAAPSSPVPEGSGDKLPLSPLRRTTRSLLARLPESKGDSVLHSAFLPKMTTLLIEAQVASGQPPSQAASFPSPSFPSSTSSATSKLQPPFVTPLIPTERVTCDFATCAVHVAHRMKCIYGSASGSASGSVEESVDLDASILPPTAIHHVIGFLPIEDKLLTRAVIKLGIDKWQAASQVGYTHVFDYKVLFFKPLLFFVEILAM